MVEPLLGVTACNISYILVSEVWHSCAVEKSFTKQQATNFNIVQRKLDVLCIYMPSAKILRGLSAFHKTSFYKDT